MRELCLIIEEDLAEVIDAAGDVVWSSDDDEEFTLTDETDGEEIIAYLVKSREIESAEEIGQITDDRDDADTDSDDDDDDDDD